jgi:hypothetical protein
MLTLKSIPAGTFSDAELNTGVATWALTLTECNQASGVSRSSTDPVSMASGAPDSSGNYTSTEKDIVIRCIIEDRDYWKKGPKCQSGLLVKYASTSGLLDAELNHSRCIKGTNDVARGDSAVFIPIATRESIAKEYMLSLPLCDSREFSYKIYQQAMSQNCSSPYYYSTCCAREGKPIIKVSARGYAAERDSTTISGYSEENATEYAKTLKPC